MPTLVLGHVGGVPVEEVASAAAPLLGVGIAVFALIARERLVLAKRWVSRGLARPSRRGTKGTR